MSKDKKVSSSKTAEAEWLANQKRYLTPVLRDIKLITNTIESELYEFGFTSQWDRLLSRQVLICPEINAAILYQIYHKQNLQLTDARTMTDEERQKCKNPEHRFSAKYNSQVHRYLVREKDTTEELLCQCTDTETCSNCYLCYPVLVE